MNEKTYISFDQFQRYQTATNLIEFFRKNQVSKKFKILELGANEHKNLGLFLQNDDILYTDVSLTESMQADEHFQKADGTQLNFPDRSFDFVLALDVLEHIPEEKRELFLENANRVAKKGAIISFPYNNKLVYDTEERVNTFYKTISGCDFIWLKEHMENGLPDIKQTLDIVKDYPHFLLYHGSLDIWEKMWYTHFQTVFAQETSEYRIKIDNFYNTNLYSKDTKNTCYRAFLVLAKEDKNEWEKYANSMFEGNVLEDDLKKLNSLCSTQSLAHNLYFEKKSTDLFQELSKNLDIILNEKKQELINMNKALLLAKKEKQLLAIALNRCQNECTQLRIQRDILNNQVFNYEHAFFWRITKPLRVLSSWLKKSAKVNRLIFLFAKGLRSLHKNGFSYTFQMIKNKRNLLKNKIIYTSEDLKMQKNYISKKAIKFSILVPLYNTPEKFLKEMIESVQNQTYANWELCLGDGSDSSHEYVKNYCLKCAKKDKRIKYKKLEKNKGISENTNACFEISTGEYIALLDHDDILHPSALFENVKVIDEQNADFIYTDEATFKRTLKNILGYHYKPDFAVDNLRANNYICHFCVFKKKLVDNLNGILFRKEFDGSQDHDMVLRLTEKASVIIHIPKVLYFWRNHPGSVASDISSKPYAINAGISAVKDSLTRNNLDAEVESSSLCSTVYKISYKLRDNPLISILIPNKDHIVDLNKCIKSILERTTYQNFEIIIIENNSIEKETFDYYDTIKENIKIKVVVYEGDFNYSKINNFGATFAGGEHLIFMNNDTEIITENWIEEMLMYSQRDDVGAVGAMLLYPNDTIQHAGIIIGLGGIAAHSHKYYEKTSPGYACRLGYSQNYSAVTGACLMMKASIFKEINGFDESFVVAYNDVDLCMRIRKQGYLIVWTPHAQLYHYESKSRGYDDIPKNTQRFLKEKNLFKARWAEELKAGDPYYNPNLTLEREDFSVK